MKPSTQSEAEFVLRRLLYTHGAEAALPHRWIWEGDRFKELIFAILTRVTKVPQNQVRQAADALSHLELLNVSKLADLPSGDDQVPEVTKLPGRQIVDVLQEVGFTEDEARHGLSVICATAKTIQHRYQSHLQNCLSALGEQMVQELIKEFRLPGLSDLEVRYAMRLWLQNVFNFPLLLQDEVLLAFCAKYDISVEDLTAAAIELGLNIALIDDLAALHYAKTAINNNVTPRRPGELL
jgi:hypothetical protein